MERAKITSLYDLTQTIAGEYLARYTYPWEALNGDRGCDKRDRTDLGPERI